MTDPPAELSRVSKLQAATGNLLTRIKKARNKSSDSEKLDELYADAEQHMRKAEDALKKIAGKVWLVEQRR